MSTYCGYEALLQIVLVLPKFVLPTIQVHVGVNMANSSVFIYFGFPQF